MINLNPCSRRGSSRSIPRCMSVASDDPVPYERLRDVDLDALPVGAFRTDRAGRYLAVNERWSDLTGMPAADALGVGWVDSIHRDDRDEVVAAWNGAIFTQSGFEREYRVIPARGEEIWVRVRAMPTREVEASGYVGVIDDMSGRVASEHQLRREHAELTQAREHLDTVLTSLENLVFTTELRPDGASQVTF